MLEDATELAVAGQSPRLTPSQHVDVGRRLQAAALEIAIVAEAATIVANQGINGRQSRRKSGR